MPREPGGSGGSGPSAGGSPERTEKRVQPGGTVPRTARLALTCLREHEGERTLIRLARDVARRRHGGPPTAGEIRAVYRQLYLDGLDHLVVAGLVTYSEEDGTVRLASGER